MTQLNTMRSIGQIVMTNKAFRMLGLTAVQRGAGVTTTSQQLARAMAAGGQKTLLIVMPALRSNQPRHHDDRGAASHPLRTALTRSVQGYDSLRGAESDAMLASLSTAHLRNILNSEFSDYDRIVFDLPPVCEESRDGLNNATVAVICDRVLLVCLVNVDTRADLAEAAALLRSAGAPLAGVISNEFQRIDPIALLRQSGSKFTARLADRRPQH